MISIDYFNYPIINPNDKEDLKLIIGATCKDVIDCDTYKVLNIYSNKIIVWEKEGKSYVSIQYVNWDGDRRWVEYLSTLDDLLYSEAGGTIYYEDNSNPIWSFVDKNKLSEYCKKVINDRIIARIKSNLSSIKQDINRSEQLLSQLKE